MTENSNFKCHFLGNGWSYRREILNDYLEDHVLSHIWKLCSFYQHFKVADKMDGHRRIQGRLYIYRLLGWGRNSARDLGWSLLVFSSHATIFQTYMWRHRSAGGLKKTLYLRSGSQRHRHFVSSLKCLSYTDTGPTFLYGDSDTPPLLSPFTTRWGYGGRILDLNPLGPLVGTGRGLRPSPSQAPAS